MEKEPLERALQVAHDRILAGIQDPQLEKWKIRKICPGIPNSIPVCYIQFKVAKEGQEDGRGLPHGPDVHVSTSGASA